jgi:hypothetical protein
MTGTRQGPDPSFDSEKKRGITDRPPLWGPQQVGNPIFAHRNILWPERLMLALMMTPGPQPTPSSASSELSIRRRIGPCPKY